MASGELAGFSQQNAKIILDVVRYLRANGFVVPQPSRGQQFIPPPASIYVRNDSGVVVPPFACMQTTGTVEDGGQNYITIDQPSDTTATAGAYLFNGLQEIEVGGYGIAHDGPLCRMLTDGTALNSGDKCQPTVGQWYIELGGDLITVVGDDDIEADVVRGVIGSSGGGDSVFGFKTTGAMTSGSAAGSIYPLSETAFASPSLTGQTIIASILFGTLATGTIGYCVKSGGVYYVIQASCPAEEEEEEA